MPNLTSQEVQTLAAIARLEIADERAETIAPRLQAVLESLDKMPPDELASVEPALVFAPYEGRHE